MMIPLKLYPAMKAGGLLPRDVWVWTPPAYDTQPHMRFPVIYMHDGQNLFFPEKSYTHITWGVVETITKLSAWGFIQPAIVVGIDNTENRFGDYLPLRPYETSQGQAFLESLTGAEKEELDQIDWVADQYLELLVAVIKPCVDQDFRTLPDFDHTFVMGSSMGGLISLYALVEYPQVFGGAGCLSTAWPAMQDFMLPYLQEKLLSSGEHKIYYDYGTEGLDAEYAPYQQSVDALMAEKGYLHGVDWLTRLYPGADHHELAWRSRLHIALRFLLGNNL
jgi:predicted alpha/beta superfamily hydrolase